MVNLFELMDGGNIFNPVEFSNSILQCGETASDKQYFRVYWNVGIFGRLEYWNRGIVEYWNVGR